jgi:hypothetical protein
MRKFAVFIASVAVLMFGCADGRAEDQYSMLRRAVYSRWNPPPNAEVVRGELSIDVNGQVVEYLFTNAVNPQTQQSLLAAISQSSPLTMYVPDATDSLNGIVRVGVEFDPKSARGRPSMLNAPLKQLGQSLEPTQPLQARRSQESLDCSAQADALGLHGTERAAFRSQCKANAGAPTQQPNQQVVGQTTSMTTQECSAKYQEAKAAGSLAGRNWMEFRSTECSSGSQPALKLVLPKDTSSVPKLAAATNVDVFSYCKAVINLDNHGNTTINSQSEVKLAKALNTRLFDWRCMDGNVLACETGASGNACQKMNSSKLPTAAISAFCLQQPNTEFVPMSIIGNSSASWKCVETVPQILKSVQLDKHNFMKGSWRKVDNDAPQSQTPPQEAAPVANVPLSQDEIDAFRKVILNWGPPPGAPALDVRIRLKEDGTIYGTPEVLSNGAGATFEAAKNSATRTVIQAQPFKMFRPESYNAWKDMIVTFEAPVAQAAQQPQADQNACITKYEAAKIGGTIGTISREDFLRVCSISAGPVMPK